MIDASQVSVAGVTLLVAREIWSVVKARMSNGNGKEPAQQQVVKIEQPHDGQVGVPGWKEHMDVVKNVSDLCGDLKDVKRDVKDTNERITRIDGGMMELAKVSNHTQQKLDVILSHYGLSEWGKGK